MEHGHGRGSVRAVLWDLDGTILDTKEGVLAAFRHTLISMDCAVLSDDELALWIGPPLPKSLRLHTSLDDAEVEEALRIYGEFYNSEGVAMTHAFPGVPELIRRLHDGGTLLGLATSKPCSAAFRLLESIGLLEMFVARGCADEDEKRGNKLEVMSDAIAGLAEGSLTPDQMVMVGDRIYDFDAAATLGVSSVAVGWGYGDAEERGKADHQVNTAAELAEFFGARTVAPLSE